MVAGMALQTQSGLADIEQIGIGRTMGGVADHAVFGHRRMLIRKRSTVLRVASQTELIHVGAAQIVAGRTTMGIMAVHARHFGFAQGMVVGHAELAALGLVAFEAGIVALPTGPHDDVRFRRHRSRCELGACGGIEGELALGRFSECALMNLVAINAAQMIRGM